jgi:beta-glucosidase
VLFGDVNPSGKLPATFPKKLSDSPAHSFGASGFPGVNGTVTYSEGILVGYRWFDTKSIEPQFPFGYGLSYTKFDYSGLKLIPAKDGVTVQFEIKNSGKRAGAEVAQIYVQPGQSKLPRPIKELKGFEKIMLKPGEKKTVSVNLGKDAFAYYDDQKSSWVAEQGTYQIQVGASSRDVRLTGEFKLIETSMFK